MGVYFSAILLYNRSMKIKPKREVSDVITPREVAFCAEYMKDFNGTQAVVRMKIKVNIRSARSIAWSMLQLPRVQNYLRYMAERDADKRLAIVKPETIIKELHAILTSDVGKIFDEDNNTLLPLNEMPPEIRKAISSVEVAETYEGSGEDRVWTGYTRKVKFWSKEKSAELLGKHLQMWMDTMHVNGDVNIVMGHRVKDPIDVLPEAPINE